MRHEVISIITDHIKEDFTSMIAARASNAAIHAPAHTTLIRGTLRRVACNRLLDRLRASG